MEEPAGRLHAGTEHLQDLQPYRWEMCSKNEKRRWGAHSSRRISSYTTVSYKGINAYNGGHRKRTIPAVKTSRGTRGETVRSRSPSTRDWVLSWDGDGQQRSGCRMSSAKTPAATSAPSRRRSSTCARRNNSLLSSSSSSSSWSM